MKIYYFLLITIVFLTPIHSEVFIFQGKQLNIPTPEGFILTTSEFQGVAKFAKMSETKDSKLLAYFFLKEFEDEARKGHLPNQENAIHVLIPYRAPNPFTKKDVDETKEMQRQALRKSPIPGGFNLVDGNRIVSQKLKDLSEAFSTKINLQMREPKTLDHYLETDNSFSIISLIPVDGQIAGVQVNRVMALITTFVRVNNLAVVIHSYSPADSLEKNINRVHNLISKIELANN